MQAGAIENARVGDRYLGMLGISLIADYFVIATGNSTIHLVPGHPCGRKIAGSRRALCAKDFKKPADIVDFGDVVHSSGKKNVLYSLSASGVMGESKDMIS